MCLGYTETYYVQVKDGYGHDGDGRVDEDVEK